MKGTSIFCFLFALLNFSTTGFAQEYLSGSIVDQRGNATKISRVRADSIIGGKFKGKDIKIKFLKLKKLEYLGNYTYRVTNKANKQFKIEEGYIVTPDRKKKYDIKYFFFDEISLEEKAVDIYDEHKVVNTITFGENIGRMKFNQRTKKYFPSDYIFDPFTGEKLTWKNPEY